MKALQGTRNLKTLMHYSRRYYYDLFTLQNYVLGGRIYFYHFCLITLMTNTICLVLLGVTVWLIARQRQKKKKSSQYLQSTSMKVYHNTLRENSTISSSEMSPVVEQTNSCMAHVHSRPTYCSSLNGLHPGAV